MHGLGTKTLEDVGAGDQGHMFGYATDETEQLMPLTHVLATQLGYMLTEVRLTLIWAADSVEYDHPYHNSTSILRLQQVFAGSPNARAQTSELQDSGEGQMDPTHCLAVSIQA